MLANDTDAENDALSPEVVTAASHGNATGLGLADFTTRRLVEAVNWRETHLNALTALDPLHPTVMQGKTITGSFHDGDHSFTLKDSNSYFNDRVRSKGKI